MIASALWCDHDRHDISRLRMTRLQQGSQVELGHDPRSFAHALAIRAGSSPILFQRSIGELKRPQRPRFRGRNVLRRGRVQERGRQGVDELRTDQDASVSLGFPPGSKRLGKRILTMAAIEIVQRQHRSRSALRKSACRSELWIQLTLTPIRYAHHRLFLGRVRW